MGMRRYQSNPRSKIHALKPAKYRHPPNPGSRSEPKPKIEPSLDAAIEIERDTLAKADSVLGCLVIALEHGADSSHAPYYPDVAQIARDLVQQSLRGLDAVNLQRERPPNKVKDEMPIGLGCCGEEMQAPRIALAPIIAVSALVPAAARPWGREFACRALRLHWREYGSRGRDERVNH